MYGFFLQRQRHWNVRKQDTQKGVDTALVFDK